MIIRKQMKFEAGHIVRNCTSDRCSKSFHGHSFLVEFFFTSDKLDAGGMIMDFGIMDNIKRFVDMFDHTTILWDKESEEVKEFYRKHSARLLLLSQTPSAENLSLIFLFAANRIIENTTFANGEGSVNVVSARVHETATGYAEAFKRDLDTFWIRNHKADEIFTGVSDELLTDYINTMFKNFNNKTPNHQIFQ